MNHHQHLPVMGVGPIYVITIIFVTMVGVFLHLTARIPVATVEALNIPFTVLGVLMIIIGCTLWVKANFSSRLTDHIKSNTLIKTGVYACVRHPIYSAFTLVCTGVLLLMNNLWLMILPIAYWLFLTILMKKTEERWLQSLYGEEYIEYCKTVNRCIPWMKNS